MRSAKSFAQLLIALSFVKPLQSLQSFKSFT